MDELSDEQRQAVAAAGWSEEEVSAFITRVDEFRAGLSDKELDVFDRAMALAREATSADDVSGFVVVNAIIAIIISPLVPDPPTPRVPGSPTPPPRPPPPPGRPPA